MLKRRAGDVQDLRVVVGDDEDAPLFVPALRRAHLEGSPASLRDRTEGLGQPRSGASGRRGLFDAERTQGVLDLGRALRVGLLVVRSLAATVMPMSSRSALAAPSSRPAR
ncbi:hypothetical protein [Streptomyces sp. HD]|uniref:hypothetical protein n=1 Tax=Streptomyces sp. HD TaxID=3020892 RepID=UPI00232E508F|nr:hypothetical protein [Streptomyces sp. HD]MDC0771492.1 hypothetical protein [Streptomyces sp. HD]